MILPPHPTPADKLAAFNGLVAAMLMAFRALDVNDLERALIADRVGKDMRGDCTPIPRADLTEAYDRRTLDLFAEPDA